MHHFEWLSVCPKGIIHCSSPGNTGALAERYPGKAKLNLTNLVVDHSQQSTWPKSSGKTQTSDGQMEEQLNYLCFGQPVPIRNIIENKLNYTHFQLRTSELCEWCWISNCETFNLWIIRQGAPRACSPWRSFCDVDPLSLFFACLRRPLSLSGRIPGHETRISENSFRPEIYIKFAKFSVALCVFSVRVLVLACMCVLATTNFRERSMNKEGEVKGVHDVKTANISYM